MKADIMLSARAFDLFHSPLYFHAIPNRIVIERQWLA